MIRINLLGVERPKARKGPVFDAARQLTLVCGLILGGTGLGVGWWYWSLTQEAAGVDAAIAAARQEQARLQSLIAEVQQFEGRRLQLQQRVGLIEELRAGQSIPVQLLDHVSRSVPDLLWLTEMAQEEGALTIQGRSTTLIALSDFVGNLGASDLLTKPIELVDSQVEPEPTTQGQPGVDVIRFTVRAAVRQPQSQTSPAASPASAPAAVHGRGGGAGD